MGEDEYIIELEEENQRLNNILNELKEEEKC